MVHDVGEVLDVEWIATDEELAHPIDVGRYGRLAVGLGVGFAPAGDALVGIDPDEDEILCLSGGDQEMGDAGDLHRALTSVRTDAGDFSMGSSGSWRQSEAPDGQPATRVLLVDSKDVSFGILGVNQPSNAGYGHLGDYYGAAVGDDLVGVLIDGRDVDR